MANFRPLVIEAGIVEQLQAADNLTLGTDDLIVGDVDASGSIDADGNVSGTDLIADDDVIAGDAVTAVGDVSGGSLTTAGLLTAGDALITDDLSVVDDAGIGGDLAVTGSITSVVNVVASGNISGVDITASDTMQCEDLLIRTDATAAPKQAIVIQDTGDANAEVFAVRVFPDADFTICIGAGAGNATMTGIRNTIIGEGAGAALTTGDRCVLIGVTAGSLTQDGAANFAVGYQALRDNVSGDENVAFGVNALVASTANANTCVGAAAGQSLTTGDSNTFIGRFAGNNASQATTVLRSIVIGANSYSEANDTITVGENSHAGTQTNSIVIGADSSGATFRCILIGDNLTADTANRVVIGSTTYTSTIVRGTAGSGGLRVVNGTNAQAAHVYNTWTSDTNMERASVVWSSNVARLQTEKGSVGGTARALALGTDATIRTQINSDGTVLASSCYQPNKVVLGYGSGANYTLTTSSAEVNEGTDSAITLDQAGTYLVSGWCELYYSGATYGTSSTVTFKLRRTNNTAADLTNGGVQHQTFQLTTFTGSIHLNIPAVSYTTANTDDRIALFIDHAAGPTAGSLQVVQSSITAERIG